MMLPLELLIELLWTRSCEAGSFRELTKDDARLRLELWCTIKVSKLARFFEACQS